MNYHTIKTKCESLLLLMLPALACLQLCACDILQGDPGRDNALSDVNATSPTFEQEVRPEDYKGVVSAWYFGHST